MIDLLLVSIPRRSPNIQYASVVPEALGRLKGSLENAGFSCRCLDFNIDYFRNSFVKQDIFQELEEYFQDVEEREFIKQYHQLSDASRDFWFQMIDRWVDEIEKINPKRLGISIFSDQSLRAAFDLCQEVRRRCKGIKILVGGLPISTTFHGSTMIGDLFIKTKMADDFISGEAEISIVEFMKGNRDYPGVNNYNFKQIEKLDSIPLPNYDDINFKKYILPNPMDLRGRLNPMISITGSRGCTKACLFCDVGHFWPKYRWVSPDRLADEIIYYYEKYGISNFHFSDSIVNASLTMFRKLLDRLIEYKETNNAPFYFVGQMIVREINNFPEIYFEKMKRAGFGLIMYGVESGSPDVRRAMNKVYSQEALYFTLEMCQKYKINAQAMIIVGYPTEKMKDFELTCKLFKDFAPEPKSPPLTTFSISTFTMDSDSKECRLHKEHEKYGIHFDPIIGWVSEELNRFEALKRTLRAYELIEGLGFPIYEEWRTEIENDLERISNYLEKREPLNAEPSVQEFLS